MAVKPEKIIGRVRALYPNANLSTSRLTAIAGRLSNKPADDADDSAIDEIIKDYNDNGAMTFEEIAKSDDQIRTLQASKDLKKEEVKKEEVKVDPDEPAWFKAYRESNDAKLAKIEQEKTKETITSKFANDERVKNIPAIIRKGFTPTSEEDYESNVEALVAEYAPYAEKLKLAGFTGEDNPASSTGGADAKKGTVKAKSAEEVKDIADSI